MISVVRLENCNFLWVLSEISDVDRLLLRVGVEHLRHYFDRLSQCPTRPSGSINR
jgi:hypothetical protein